MKDLMKQIDSRAGEVAAYIAEIRAERESHHMRLKELEINERDAQRDLDRLNRAMRAISGDDEPSMGPSPESPRAQEVSALMAKEPYRPTSNERYEGGF